MDMQLPKWTRYFNYCLEDLIKISHLLADHYRSSGYRKKIKKKYLFYTLESHCLGVLFARRAIELGGRVSYYAKRLVQK